MNKNFKNHELKSVSSKPNALMTPDMVAKSRHGSQKPNPLSPFVSTPGQAQTELIATRRELAESLQLFQLSDTRVADAQEHLEMAMLDKEVAEE